MVLTDYLGREVTYSVLVHAADAEQVRPVIYLDYGDDETGNAKTTISTPESIPFRIGLSNADQADYIQDGGANVCMRLVALDDADTIVAEHNGTYAGIYSFIDGTEYINNAGIDQLDWSKFYTRGAKKLKLYLV